MANIQKKIVGIFRANECRVLKEASGIFPELIAIIYTHLILRMYQAIGRVKWKKWHPWASFRNRDDRFLVVSS